MITQQTKTPIKVKKIGHVVYEVSDLDRSKEFWTEVMGFNVSDVNENGMVFLNSAGDHHGIALVPSPGKKKPSRDDKSTLQIHHWAMEVDSIETLFAARDFLKARGIPISYEGRRGPGGNIGVEFKDPDGYVVEIYVDMDQVRADGKSRPPNEWRRATSLEEAVANPLPSH